MKLGVASGMGTSYHTNRLVPNMKMLLGFGFTQEHLRHWLPTRDVTTSLHRELSVCQYLGLSVFHEPELLLGHHNQTS